MLVRLLFQFASISYLFLNPEMGLLQVDHYYNWRDKSCDMSAH